MVCVHMSKVACDRRRGTGVYYQSVASSLNYKAVFTQGLFCSVRNNKVSFSQDSPHLITLSRRTAVTLEDYVNKDILFLSFQLYVHILFTLHYLIYV